MISPTAFSVEADYIVRHPKKLQQQLITALHNKGKDYKARTRHLINGQPFYTNRLIFEDSPYLLQHAHNPVNWYSWSDEAFAVAKRENKPIFLSIGYATCHWCHVMEEESFESIEVAKILNENFIAIKVDREQHPDIDTAYMMAVTMLTGHGGWPMSSFITAEGKPFFGGTYYPKPSFIDLLLKIKTAWKDDKLILLQQADQVAGAVKDMMSQQSSVTSLEQSTIETVVKQVLQSYDAQSGGFSSAPKFPNEPILLLLLQQAERNHSAVLMQAVEHTLSAMAQGGMYDQIGGGFHRYSTDEHWLIPHFEKMLYNQAYLSRVYAQAYRLTNNPLFARTARQTLDYVLREMTASSGVFYSASDADSNGEEGQYFIWTADEIKKNLNKVDAGFIVSLFGVTEKGNFEGKNILFLPQTLDQVAKRQEQSLSQLLARVDPLLIQLRNVREKRLPPLIDNKIIVAWNGMFITALSEAGDILNEPKYIDAAIKATDALMETQITKDNELLRINLNGNASVAAKQDDYAHFAEALIALYDVTSEERYLKKAKLLTDKMTAQFMDAKSGVLVMGKDKLLFTQPKDDYDGALPSGNAVAVLVFNRLYQRLGEQNYNDKATKILQTFSGRIEQNPRAYTYMLAQLDELKKGEITAHRFAARGAIKIDAETKTEGANQKKLILKFSIKPGWHINSHQPLQKQLIATDIAIGNSEFWELKSIQYPQPKRLKTEFEDQPLALYQGQFKITADLTAKAAFKYSAVKIKLTLQACNRQSCLAPEELILYPSDTF